MGIKIRRVLFYSLTAIFIILAFIIIPYSNGWRFDFKTFGFAKLGGMYLEIKPSDAAIKIDKLITQLKPGFLKSGVLIANLFPKTYRVSVQKEGFQSWHKDIPVKSSLVTQIHPILLLPEKLDKQAVAEKTTDIYPSPDYLAWKGVDNKLKINGKTIKGTEFVAWLSGGKTALTLDIPTATYFAINPGQGNIASNINLIFENLKYQKSITDTSKITAIIAHPSDKNKVVLATGKSAYLLDFAKPSLIVIKTGAHNLLGAGADEIYFSDSKTLYAYNIVSQAISVVLQKKILSLEIAQNGQFLALSDGNSLYLLDKNNLADPKSLMAGASYFKFSPDGKKLAATNNNGQINIFFIGDDSVCRLMSAGDTVYLSRNLPHKACLHEGCDYARALSVYSE